MRIASVYSVDCPCGTAVEWPDTSRETRCGNCGRALVVECWPNVGLLTLAPGEAA